ncbi:transcriptional regulator [Cupriavidus pauculus]|uniref:Transcriptional regulator n=2 Tax=Cupriavidus pauculus TaxID=82633 RepID=A0A2N5CFW6_9BURK|nr:anti-sigma factor [Cupriavidus pauculus]PLQ01113.1 transcriptional regulator [Cupriavidus pauculus]
MMSPQTPVSEADLHAYADGQLHGPRRAEVEAFLAADADAANKVEAWRHQAAALHAGLDGVLNEAVPLAALPRQLHAQGGRARPARLAWPLALAASLCALVVGAAGGWYARDHVGADAVAVAPMERFAREALASYVVYAPEVRHVVEVPASDEAHLIAWLSKRLGASLQVPDLHPQGFRLIGGRLGASEGGPMAILMYEDDAGTRVSLQLRRMAQGTPDTAFRLERLPPRTPARSPAGHATMAFYWVDRDLGFALAGPLERERLLALAQVVYQQYQRG